MATIKRELSSKTNSDGKSQIILRVSIGRGLQPRIKSGLYIHALRFKDGTIIKPRANQAEATELRALETQLTALEQYILNVCTTTPREQLTKLYLDEVADRYNFPEKYESQTTKQVGLWDVIPLFLDKRPFSNTRCKQYHVLGRALKRFAIYAKIKHLPIAVTLDGLTSNALDYFTTFLLNEEMICQELPKIYEEVPAYSCKEQKSRTPKPRGNNYLSNLFRMLRAFYNWCIDEGITSNNPFTKFKGIPSERYGTPYYLNIDERDCIANHDFSDRPQLATQRDIFIFHCLIGCRVSDLMRLTKANVINGAIEYIAQKTKEDHPELIRVPLHPIASDLIDRYKGKAKDGKLFPFISPQKYNDAIKRIFAECSITRLVTVLNTVTGDEEQLPINEIASSHIARRTFIGNLYKKVKDPNLIGHLSGHVEGSKAFARYRDIDEDVKKEVINLL